MSTSLQKKKGNTKDMCTWHVLSINNTIYGNTCHVYVHDMLLLCIIKCSIKLQSPSNVMLAMLYTWAINIIRS